MQRQRAELVPIGEVIAGMGGPAPAIPAASPQADLGTDQIAAKKNIRTGC